MVTLTGKISPTPQPLNTGLASSLALFYEHFSKTSPQGSSTLSSSINSIDVTTWLAARNPK